MKSLCKIEECLAVQDLALQTKDLKKLRGLLKKCYICEAANKRKTVYSLTKRIVKAEFEYAMFREDFEWEKLVEDAPLGLP